MLALLASLLVSAAPAQAAVLPGGKANWVVAIGGLEEFNNARNWVRLGTYEFSINGTVKTTYWSWNQRDRPMRVNAMRANCPGAVPDCPIRTVDGFTGAPTGSFTGTFTYTPGHATVTWDGGKVERWTVVDGLAGGKVARMFSTTYYGDDQNAPIPKDFSNYGATFGVGYGSNASLNTRISTDQLLDDSHYNAEAYKGAFVRYTSDMVRREAAGGDWHYGDWSRCDGAPCAGYLQYSDTCKKNLTTPTNPNPSPHRVRYIGQIGQQDRRDTEEYWCQGLAREGSTCYIWNSHPRPMLQVIDDAGEFQGWVGVEAFTHVETSDPPTPSYQYASDYWGVFDMVSVPALNPLVPAGSAVSKFRGDYGNSYTQGKVEWDKEAPRGFVNGINHVESGCRYVEAVALSDKAATDRMTSSPLCAGMEPDGTRPFEGVLSVNPDSTIRVFYWVSDDGGQNYAIKDVAICTRTQMICVDTDLTEFRATHGASVASGKLIWKNRSIEVTGLNHVESGCRYVEVAAFAVGAPPDRMTSSPLCAGMEPDGTRPFSGDLVADVEGGPGSVLITYWASDGGGYVVADTVTCTRRGCA
ncbi:hypothetical protein [Nonomuraea basaltis]|uniref:hypothetical protein n=1 Tax=Nonomuraea basaltis TaxID=2495887 RepID=UPI00110C4428|nr:hypothetical protein [Nonomuraea basaltis]TMR93151.1 hypothetical protein EJK15_40875 [Nonomuraea basaltis]